MLDVVLPLLSKRLPLVSDPSDLPPLYAAENDHKVSPRKSTHPSSCPK